MPDDSALEGGCACGRIRYRLIGAPITVNACHCRLCQRSSGSAFAVNAMIEADRIEIIGGVEPELINIPSDMAPHNPAWRCPVCAVMLFDGHVLMHDHIRFVRVGTLDEGERLSPDAHYFVSRKYPWVTLPPGVPAYATLPEAGGGPPLPPEQQARMAAAFRG